MTRPHRQRIVAICTGPKPFSNPAKPEKKTMNSPGKFARPGRPMEAMPARPKTKAMRGSLVPRPPRELISSVPVCFSIWPQSMKSKAMERPWASISRAAPFTAQGLASAEPDTIRAAKARKM